MAERSPEASIIVVGAGPVGAILALELARHGVPSLVIERSMRPSLHPKMDYINGRSMELLRRLGLADAVREIGVDPGHSTDFLFTLGLDQPPVHRWQQPSVAELRERYAAVTDASVPVEPYQRVSGSLLEGLLRAAVRDHPLIDLRDGWTFSDLRIEPDAVTAIVVDPATKERQALRARYLAACDGARSTVRRCLEIGLDEQGEPVQHCSVYFSSRDPVLRRDGRAFVTIGARGVTLVSRDERDAWTASVPVARSEPLTCDPMELIQDRLGTRIEVDTVLSVAQWEGSLSVATAYQAGPVFLAGDAAHQFYPAGGHGANTGIADGIDLGWKLAAVIQGWGGPILLDSYQAERRPVALLNRELCADLVEVFRRFGRLAQQDVPRAVLAGLLEQHAYQVDNLGAHFGYRYEASPVICHEAVPAPAWDWRRLCPTPWPGGRAPSMRLADGSHLFDQLGAGFSLIDLTPSGAGAALVGAARERGVPMRRLALTEPAAGARWDRQLVLIRPDDHVAWRANEAPAPEAWSAVLNRVTGWPASADPGRPAHGGVGRPAPAMQGEVPVNA